MVPHFFDVYESYGEMEKLIFENRMRSILVEAPNTPENESTDIQLSENEWTESPKVKSSNIPSSANIEEKAKFVPALLAEDEELYPGMFYLNEYAFL